MEGGRGLESAGWCVFFLEDVVAGLRSDRKRMGRIEGGTDGTEDGRLLCPPAMVVWTSLFVSGATDERRGRREGDERERR